MSFIDGPQLQTLTKLLDLQQSGQSGLTEVDDDRLTQVIDASQPMRRGLTMVGSTGWFIGVMENVHSGADTESSDIDPYRPGATQSTPVDASTGGYDAEGMDVWICGVGIHRTSGAGDLTGAQVRFSNPAATPTLGLGWGIDDSEAVILDAQDQPIIAAFAGIQALAGVAAGIEVGTGLLTARVIQRVRRGNLLRFNSTSAAAATFRAVFRIGLFPQSLGQDLVG